MIANAFNIILYIILGILIILIFKQCIKIGRLNNRVGEMTFLCGFGVVGLIVIGVLINAVISS